jgi:allantoate deiminase/N-carbamoyl-L-amino-acid hydrolase
MQGAGIVERAAKLGRHSDSPDHYTRTLFTPAHRAAAAEIARWMSEAGMAVRTDPIGNVIGRYEGAAADAKTLLMGSHFDSVRNGGKFDGVLGILVPIACIAELNARGERLRVALEVAAFSDEEGARFQTSFLSSRALVGRFDPSALERCDSEGVSLAAAMREAGLDPAEAPRAALDPSRLAGYVEVHIEQGPVLLDAGQPLGVVTSIASGIRYLVHVTGEAGHAGTVPMSRRHDALAAAAEMVLAVEKQCAAVDAAVGTVGILKVKDGTGNVIPGEVDFTVDVRAPDDARRHEAEALVLREIERIAKRRGVSAQPARGPHDVKGVPCAPWLQDRLAQSIERCVGGTALRLPSGAGHDAMILAEVTDVGMLFVRCGAGGVSHNPAETVTAGDAGLASGVLLDFLRHF